MNGAMMLQHAAGVIEDRWRTYGSPERSFTDTAALVTGSRSRYRPGAGGVVPDRSEVGRAHARSGAAQTQLSTSGTPGSCGR